MNFKFKRAMRTAAILIMMTAVAVALIYFGKQEDKSAFENMPLNLSGNISPDDKFMEDMEQIKFHAYEKRIKYISKMLESEADTPVNTLPNNGSKDKSLEQKIRDYLGKNVSKVGIGYYDIQNGKGFSINGDKYFTAASTVKVQMNMVLFDMVKEGKVDINEALKYTQADYEAGTGILQGKDKTNPIPLLTLSDYSIIYSDNIATNMIMRRIGRTEMKKRFGQKVGHTVPVENLVTPNEGLTFLKQLYENKGNNQYYTRLIGIMKTTVFHDRLDAYVPKEIVAHKIGNYGSFANDVGIVYAPKPYIIAVYTDGLSNANEVIATINKMLYQEHK